MIDKLLLEHVGLSLVLDLAVHLVNFFGLMDQGDHSEPLLLLALFYSFMVKRYGCWWWWWSGVGGPCENSVSPRPKSFFFGSNRSPRCQDVCVCDIILKRPLKEEACKQAKRELKRKLKRELKREHTEKAHRKH